MLNMVLASSSARRKELLSMIGLQPQIIPPDINEEMHEAEAHEKFLERVAISKAMNVYRRTFHHSLVIGADTIVRLEGEIIGKPKDRPAAAKMLQKLSDRCHEVWTGLALLYQGQTRFDISRTRVFFKKLSAEEIDFYLDHEEYLDKAGAYAVQGKASVFVTRVEGCYFNVMGFPLNLFYHMLETLDIRLYEPSAHTSAAKPQ